MHCNNAHILQCAKLSKLKKIQCKSRTMQKSNDAKSNDAAMQLQRCESKKKTVKLLCKNAFALYTQNAIQNLHSICKNNARSIFQPSPHRVFFQQFYTVLHIKFHFFFFFSQLVRTNTDRTHTQNDHTNSTYTQFSIHFYAGFERHSDKSYKMAAMHEAHFGAIHTVRCFYHSFTQISTIH